MGFLDNYLNSANLNSQYMINNSLASNSQGIGDLIKNGLIYNPQNVIGQATGYGAMITGNHPIQNMFDGEKQPSDSGGSIGLTGANATARNADLEAGYSRGRQMFYDDPDMQMLRDKRMDLAKGYNGQELGAMKAQAQNDVASQRANYMRQLYGKAARAGVGGARAAAMGATADKGFQANRAELERKMALDNSNLVREGTNSLQDYLFRQKYGELGTGLGYGQLGVADRTAQTQADIAAKERKRGPIDELWENTVGGLF